MEVTAMSNVIRVLALAGILTGSGFAQTRTLTSVQHLNFDTPEAWALKYFTSVTMLSGLQPPETAVEQRKVGSLTVGLETVWIPALNAERARVGFSGRKQEDLNKAPVLIRPSVRVGLPWRFSLVVAGPPPLEAFGVRPHLFAFGVERPLVERENWRLGWRASGQVGSVTSAFTCPKKVLAFAPGSPENPSACIAESADEVTMRYGGTELQFSHRLPGVPKLTPHVAAGINYVDGTFQVNAPRQNALDHTRMWSRGRTFSGTAGISYLLTKRAALTVDAFYSPLWIRRAAGGPRVIDGLFNVRALLSYSLR
jgi:hypothetical protein